MHLEKRVFFDIDGCRQERGGVKKCANLPTSHMDGPKQAKQHKNC